MDEVMLAHTSSDECEDQRAGTQMDALPDLRNQILQLFCTRLRDNSIIEMLDELQVMQRSTYYLEIQHDDLLPTADEQQHTLSDSTVWSVIDNWRLQRALTLTHTHVKLLIIYLGLLYEEIMRGCRELEAFIIKYDKGLVDSNMAASTQQKLQQTHQNVNKFKWRLTQNVGPLSLQSQLMSNAGTPHINLSASLAIKKPVILNRLESCTASTTVHLCWEVKGEQSEELDQQFEIQVKSLHPSIAEHGQFSKYACQSNTINVNNLYLTGTIDSLSRE